MTRKGDVMNVQRRRALRDVSSVVMAATFWLACGPALAAAQPNQEDARPADRLLQAQSALALRLVDKLAAGQPGANIVISPASLAGALAVIERGGTPQFQTMLHTILGFKKSPAAWVDFDALRRATGKDRGAGPLASANGIFFDAGTAPYAEAIEALSRDGVDSRIVDFGSQETLAAINAWVNERTKGKIPTILDALSKDTGLVALNALYFKDSWKQPFDADKTSPAPFHLVGGQDATVALMNSGEIRQRFRQDARFVAADFPYATAGYSLVVITTKNGAAPAKDFAGLADWTAGSGFSEAPGEVALPRFGAQTNIDLMPALAGMGFKPPSVLPGFAKGPLRVSKAQQRVELKVDEEGTEAAAATAVPGTRSLDTSFVKMVVDKPFVFALRDATTGLIIVAGYVAKPEEPTKGAAARPSHESERLARGNAPPPSVARLQD
jgi:serpin B